MAERSAIAALTESRDAETAKAYLTIVERARERYRATGVAHVGGERRRCRTEGPTSRQRLPANIDALMRPLLEAGWTHIQVAAKLGISVCSVSSRSRGMGIRRR
jgi:hypothetical protein